MLTFFRVAVSAWIQLIPLHQGQRRLLLQQQQLYQQQQQLLRNLLQQLLLAVVVVDHLGTPMTSTATWKTTTLVATGMEEPVATTTNRAGTFTASSNRGYEYFQNCCLIA